MNFSSLINDCQINLGVEKLKLGAILSALEASEEWKKESSATTFRRYLKELNLEPNAMFQYMRVADVFIKDLSFDEARIRKIACVSMRTLEMAAKVITPANADEILNIITSMPRAEAIEELAGFSEKKMFEPGISKATRNLLRQLEDLSESSRIEFTNEIRKKLGPAQRAKEIFRA